MGRNAFATAALAQTALHLVPPRLATSERTLSIARKHLVQAKELSDFEFLAANPVWRDKPLKTLLEHVELARYNRELINWKLDDQVYREFVLSPLIDPRNGRRIELAASLVGELLPPHSAGARPGGSR